MLISWSLQGWGRGAEREDWPRPHHPFPTLACTPLEAEPGVSVRVTAGRTRKEREQAIGCITEEVTAAYGWSLTSPACSSAECVCVCVCVSPLHSLHAFFYSLHAFVSDCFFHMPLTFYSSLVHLITAMSVSHVLSAE